MTSFSHLTDFPPREAWPNEARDFTPWLVQNIDHLSHAVGLDLEVSDTEVSVEQFSADIIASDVRTGASVLIENQLERSDHRHLGQIMTYLAGLDARVVIWVARDFEEAHRSAIRWLNDHTHDDFAFFAVRVRLVRIDDSPFAPVFEVVEKPNTWERTVERKLRRTNSELSRLREKFWDRYLQRHPGLFQPTQVSNVWFPMNLDESIFLSVYVGSTESGMFLRGPRATNGRELAEFMKTKAETLDQAFGPNQSTGNGHYYGSSTKIALQDENRWDELIDWMEDRRRHYEQTLKSVAKQDPSTVSVPPTR